MTRRVLAIVCLIVASGFALLYPGGGFSNGVWGAPPVGFQNSVWISGLEQPTTVVFMPDGGTLIAERSGAIKVVPSGSNEVAPTPFLQLSNINTDRGERGLVGLTLDPDFSTNGYVYVFYTANSPLRDRVSRFTSAGDVADASSEHVLWQDNVEASWWHHGGTVAFAPDGTLFISTGFNDDSAPGDSNGAQRLDSYHGKILRINSDGSIPSTNPFIDGSGPNLDAIWALGLRNPFRFSFDPATGAMYIGDVGGNADDSVEEVNVGVAGANYGWPFCEGACDISGMTNPIHSYSHSGRGASITGGLVYRGSMFPAKYQGNYFYADYSQNWIGRLTFDDEGAVANSVPFEPADGSQDGPYGDIVDLKVGPDGALYYVDIALDNTGQQTGYGTVRRIEWKSSGEPPEPSPTTPPGSIEEPPIARPSDPNFINLWERTDRVVADGNATRTWMWGPEPNTEVVWEPYDQAPDGKRAVQYFDKSRMEITSPDADPESIWFVTNGLLASELITGRMQLGEDHFDNRRPAEVNVAGDVDDTTGPTYATFHGLLDAPGQPAGTIVTQRLGRPGQVVHDQELVDQGIAIGYLDDVTNHGIASPFWAFMNSTGPVYEDGMLVNAALFQNPFFATGRPITEPYWATVEVGGTPRLVLIQCFERRCLTFTPDNASEWQVEMGNIGLHYYAWRYSPYGSAITSVGDSSAGEPVIRHQAR